MISGGLADTDVHCGVVFTVLGPLELPGVPDAPRPCGKQAALLAFLLLRPNAWVGADEICDALWGAAPPASADRNVKTYVWQLRRVLPVAADGGERLQGRRGGYRIRTTPGELDATVLEQAVGRVDADPAVTVSRLQEALALWRGRPYPELPEAVTRVVVARLEQVRWQLLEQLADALGGAGRFAEVIALVQPLIAEDPLREALWARLVLALTAAGRRGEALGCYQQARRVLLDELGVEPDAALQEAQRRALAGEAGPEPLAMAPLSTHSAAPTRPSYLPRAVADFGGREAEVQAVTRAVGDGGGDVARIVIIEGMPGIGKTALGVHVAHRLSERFPDGQVFCDLHGHDPDAPPVEPFDVLAGLLQAFGVRGDGVPDRLEERAGMWRSMLHGRRVLLVLDDAVSAAQVVPLLPGSSDSFAMITSRSRLSGLDGVRSVELGPLPDAAALHLLDAAEESWAGADPALSVVRLCGNLPIAVRIAAGRLRQHPSWHASGLARRLSGESRLAELCTGDRDVATVFETSVRRLSPAARHLFRVLATAKAASGPCERCVAAPGSDERVEFDVDEIARLAGLAAAHAERVLDQLLDHHLATQCPAGRYTMHGLLRAYGRSLADDDPDLPTDAERVPAGVAWTA